MQGFKFNVEEAISRMTAGVLIARANGSLSAFAVVCINEDHESSHGGVIVSVIDGQITEAAVNTAIDECIARAMDQNDQSPEGNTCKYVPLEIGVHPQFLMKLTQQLYGATPTAERPWALGSEGPADDDPGLD